MMRPSIILGSVLAATVAIVCLILAFSDDRIISPFGWNRVVVVHSISSLPLALVIAGSLCRTQLSSATKPIAVLIVSVWAVLAIMITVFGGVFITHVLEVSDAGFTIRMAVRSVWTLLIEIPCFWLILLLGRPIQMPRRAFGHLVIWAVAVELLVPFGFIMTLSNKQTELARASWQAFRIDKTIEKVDRLCAVGSMASFGMQKPQELSDSTPKGFLENKAKKSETNEVTAREAQAGLIKNATLLIEATKLLRQQEITDQNRFVMSKNLRSLGELDEAAELLKPIADRTPEAALLLGRILQAKNDWASSSEWLQVAVDQVLTTDRQGDVVVSGDAADKSIQLLHQAYDCLSQNAREMHHYEEAEQYYLKAIEHVPSDAAYFHYQLVRHYDLSGRISNSLKHHQLASELAPTRYSPPPAWLQKFLSSSTPVGILAPSQSNY